MASRAFTGAERARASRIRKKIAAGKNVTAEERAFLEAYERAKRGDYAVEAPASERWETVDPDPPRPAWSPPPDVKDAPPPPAAVASDWRGESGPWDREPDPPDPDDPPGFADDDPDDGDDPIPDAPHDDACPYGAAVSICRGCGRKYIPISSEQSKRLASVGIPVIARAIVSSRHMVEHGTAPPPMHITITDDEAELAGEAIRPLLARLALLGPVLQIGGGIAIMAGLSAQAALRAHPVGECTECETAAE